VFGQRARRIDISEPDGLPGLARCGRAAATPLRSARFSSEIISIGLGDVMLRLGRSTPVAVLGTLDPRIACLVLPHDGPEHLLMNGRVAAPDDIGVYGAGAEHEVASHDGGAWAIVILPAALVDHLVFPPRGSPMLRPGAAAVLHSKPAIRAAAAILVNDVREVVVQDTAVFAVESARRSLRCALLDAAHELLAGVPAGAPPAPLRRGAAAGRLVVRAAHDHLAADPAGASDAAGLSAALGIAPSRLARAFDAVLGLDPNRYARLRRLVMVRVALRAGPPQWVSVARAAEAHGFRQPVPFSQAYQEMFGEAPETTLGRSARSFA
jgi:AraC-like DNA-binding protein